MTDQELLQLDRRIAILVCMVAIGVVLHRLEALIPLPSPWIKIGLANVMTLVTLVFLGFRDALVVTLLRVILGSILGGTFLSPTFFLSLSGGVAATFAMALAYAGGKGPFSLIGVSIFAAYTHTLAAVICVYFLWVQQEFFFKLLPIFFTFSLITGILTGIVSNFTIQKLNDKKAFLT